MLSGEMWNLPGDLGGDSRDGAALSQPLAVLGVNPHPHPHGLQMHLEQPGLVEGVPLLE